MHLCSGMGREPEGDVRRPTRYKEKMPFKCATRRHFRLISAYAETASPPGGISISYETLICLASLGTHPPQVLSRFGLIYK